MSDWPQSPDALPPASPAAPARPAPEPEPADGASSLTRADVAHLASLVRIEATADELDRLVGELGVILDSVARVGEVAAADVPPMSHPLPLTNVTRVDEPVPGLSAQDALAAAPASEQQRFRVPRILEED